MKVTQVTIGRFSQFHLARQLERHQILDKIYTGYPKIKLEDEKGIPADKIKTFPWLQAPYMALSSKGLLRGKIKSEWAWLAHETLDKYVSSKIKQPTVLIGLSGSALRSGIAAKKAGGKYICHRGSSEISFQNTLLIDEYKRWGLEFKGIDVRKIEKENLEYEEADLIVVPSEFAKNSFISQGIDPQKVKKVIYGARMDRFKKLYDPDGSVFRVLWVGAISIRKGFLDALHAFQKLKHPNKEFLVIGSIEENIKSRLKVEDLNNVIFQGQVPNVELIHVYNSSHVFLLSSIEDGFGVVMGEALACGCPVIATTNTGAPDLYTDGVEGFIVPIRSPDIIVEKLEEIAQSIDLRNKMSEAGIKRVINLGGWDSYGNDYVSLIRSF